MSSILDRSELVTRFVYIIIFGLILASGTVISVPVASLSPNQIAMQSASITTTTTRTTTMTTIIRTTTVTRTNTTRTSVRTTFTILPTTTATSTTLVTTTVYPIPSNVTLYFTNVSGGYNYEVTYGGSTITGSDGGPIAIPLAGLLSGEIITIDASEFGSPYCGGGSTVTAQLFLNGVLVAQGSTLCTGNPIHIVYTV